MIHFHVTYPDQYPTLRQYHSLSMASHSCSEDQNAFTHKKRAFRSTKKNTGSGLPDRQGRRFFVITDSRGCLHGNAWRRFPLSIHSGRMEGIFLSHSDTICWTHLIRRVDAFKASGNGKELAVSGHNAIQNEIDRRFPKKIP